MANATWTAAARERLLKRLAGRAFYVSLHTQPAQSSKEHEVVAPGYSAGGKIAQAPTVQVAGSSVKLQFHGSVVWPNSTIKARYGLLYTSEGTEMGLDFGEELASKQHEFVVDLSDLSIEM